MKSPSGKPEHRRPGQIPEITVIIPVWNGRDHLGECLRALEIQTLPREAFEVIVVDNGSTDGTAEFAASFPGIRVINEPEPGSYRARNAGLAQALGAFVAFTDADCRPAPDWLSEALSAVRRHPDAGVIGGRIDLFSDRFSLAALYERTFAFRQSETLASGRCTTANWISPRTVLDRLGGFDGGLTSGGDYELSLRISAVCPILYADTMIVRHPARGTLAALSAKRRRTVGGRWVMRSGPFKTVRIMARGLVNTTAALKRAFGSRDLLPGQSLGVAAVIGILAVVEVDELIRLTCGKAPNRA